MRLSILTLLALIGCQDKKPAPPAAPPPPPPPHDGVVLVLPGTAPRQPLRYALTPGAVATSQLVYDLELKSDGQPSPLPVLVVDLETKVERRMPDGAARLRIAITRASVRDRAGATASELVRKEAAAMQGVAVTELVAPDGLVSDSQIEAAGALSDAARGQLANLLRSLEHAAPRFPVEPVGPGASWRERRTLPEGGIRAINETTYVLTSRTGDTIAYTSTAASAGEPQKVVQDGTTVDVTETRGHGEAAGTVDLARYAFELIASSVFSTVLTVAAPAGAPGAGRSAIEIAIKLQVSPRDAERAEAAPAAPSPDAGPAQGAHNAP